MGCGDEAPTGSAADSNLAFHQCNRKGREPQSNRAEGFLKKMLLLIKHLVARGVWVCKALTPWEMAESRDILGIVRQNLFISIF